MDCDETPDARWIEGEQVAVRGARWTVRSAAAWPDCTVLRLASREVEAGERSLLTPFDRPQRVTRSQGARVVRGRRWLHEARRFAASLEPYGGARAAAHASARLLPHQFEPLLAIRRHGATRLLIADDVGLGKTIQAGLIIGELTAADESFRGLALVPAGLRQQWADELREHVGIAAIQADAAWLRDTVRSRPPDVNPWSVPGTYLASIDFAKQPEVLRSLEEIRWTLVVVDEAHQAAAGSDRRAAAHAVACRARHVLLLTATPDAGDPARFASLCSIGQIHASEGPLVWFRRTRSDLGHAAPRRSTFLRVRPTPAEHRMHDILDRYSRRVWHEASLRRDVRARLATIILRKRALSSAASLAISARRRLDLLAGAATDPDRQLLLPLFDEEPLPDDVADRELGAPGLLDVAAERGLLEALAEAASQAAAAESKLARLLRWLARVREPAIVFTEYRDTLERLVRAIAATGRPLVTMHGGMDAAERRRAQARFNAGGVTLVATDAAAEGLNLHRHCRAVVHYELPWRPARIEQRAGRVDRLGQTRRVHEIALIATGTAERLVLVPLALRACRARASGDRLGLLEALTEEAVAGLILDDPPKPQSTHRAPAPAPETAIRLEARAEVSRLEEVRGWLAASPRAEPARGRPVLARVRPAARLRPAIALVYRLALVDDDNRAAHQEAAVFLVRPRLPLPPLPSSAALRAFAAAWDPGRLPPDTALHQLLRQRAETMLRRVVPLRRAAAAAIQRRNDLLRVAMPSASRQMVQASLFDRRALRRRARQDAATTIELFELEHDPATTGPWKEVAALVALQGVLVIGGAR
jgi:superfamily II DNA or RNA helicase